MSKTPEVPEAEPVLGDAECAAGASDCNACATDVVAQFESGAWRARRRTWSFADPGRAELPPWRAYWAWQLAHVQGFVRLNGTPERYALVHNQKGGGPASLSFVGQRGSRLELESLYRLAVANAHTSGAFVLGRYLGFIDEDRRLALVDSQAPYQHLPQRALYRTLSHPDEEEGFMAQPKAHGLSDWSGGVAMARLKGGKYLLIANEGGSSAGDSHFFELGSFESSAPNAPLSAQEVGESSVSFASQACADQSHSENVSLITECQTGQLFAVHVGSNDRVRLSKPLKPLEPGGFQTFWRVSRVVKTADGVRLDEVGVYLRKARWRYCHGRSAGTAYVDPASHRIELLCHQRAQTDSSSGTWRFLSATVEPPVSGEVLPGEVLPGEVLPGEVPDAPSSE